MGSDDARTAVPLRPLGTSEIADAGLLQWRRSIGPITRRAAIPIVVTQFIAAAIAVSAAKAREQSFTGNDDLLAYRVTFALWLGYVSVLIVSAFIARTIVPDVLGLEPQRVSTPRIGACIGAVVLASAAVAVGTVACVVPGLVLATGFAMVAVVCVVERVGPGRSVARAWKLARHHFGSQFVLLFLGLALHSLITLAFQGPVQLVIERVASGTSDVASTIAGSTAAAIAALITVPWTASIIVVSYCERRVRDEGLDIALLIDELGPVG